MLLPTDGGARGDVQLASYFEEYCVQTVGDLSPPGVMTFSVEAQLVVACTITSPTNVHLQQNLTSLTNFGSDETA